MKKIISQVFVLALYVISFEVVRGLLAERNMWQWICCYWVVLSFKNFYELFAGIGEK